MNIQWYPGHMTKTRRMMEENLSLVDVVVELIDARIPYSSKNPDIDNLAKNKFRIIVMNKSDLADETATKIWVKYFEEQGFRVLLTNSVAGKGVKNVTELARELMKEKIEAQKARGRIFVPIRAMIVGIPNVGKSTFINKYVGKTTAKTGDKPGITRGKQWIRIKKDFELLDTPGILWPKFEDKQVGLRLAFTGAINDDILESELAAVEFIKLIMKIRPKALKERYGIDFEEEENPHEVFLKIGESRGFIKKGGEIDSLRCARILFDEYRGGKLGKMTLEMPEDIRDMTEETQLKEQEKKQRDIERKREYKRKKNS